MVPFGLCLSIRSLPHCGHVQGIRMFLATFATPASCDFGQGGRDMFSVAPPVYIVVRRYAASSAVAAIPGNPAFSSLVNQILQGEL